MFEKVYELPLTRNYVAGWKMHHAVRELIQNALDSESPFEWSIRDGVLEIRSRYTTLDSKSLLLGTTTKSENESAIGSFGEGYKIALLVLLREGYDVLVLNGNYLWTPEFRHSKKFDSELLCIVERHNSAKNSSGLTFRVKLKEEGDEDLIRLCCLQMQDNIGEIIEVPQGRILVDRKGALYVGSLFICETGLDYSYDIHPKHIRLERDRQTVSNWNLKLVTKDMWFAADRIPQVVKLIEKNSPDMEYAQIGTPSVIAEACYRHFRAENPGAVIARTQEELDKLVAAGMTRVIIAGGGAHYSVVKNSKGYRSQAVVKIKTPREILSIWIENSCPDIPDHTKHNILTHADNWRLK